MSDQERTEAHPKAAAETPVPELLEWVDESLDDLRRAPLEDDELVRELLLSAGRSLQMAGVYSAVLAGDGDATELFLEAAEAALEKDPEMRARLRELLETAEAVLEGRGTA